MFQCEYCEREYNKFNKNLLLHYRRIHPDGYEFYKKSKYEDKILNEEAKKNKCLNCKDKIVMEKNITHKNIYNME